MESIFKMVILLLFIHPSESCIFTIFKPIVFKFLILIENYIGINDTFGFFDSLSISSEIELGLGTSRIRIFKIIFNNYLRIFPTVIIFRVDPMIYFDISNH
jgi:hypothetical protein